MASQKNQQTTPYVLMIRPANFGFNEETADSNAFQRNDTSLTPLEIRKRAIAEFDDLAYLLQQSGVDVTVISDTERPIKTDAVFPNNWVSFHEDGTIVTYPMYSEIRRTERREDILEKINCRFRFQRRLRLEEAEEHGQFLEGTGSLVLDRVHRIAYACASVRTHPILLEAFCTKIGYEKVLFSAADKNGKAVYHTNVMMSVADQFAVVCLEAVPNSAERQLLVEKLQAAGKAIVEISLEQMMCFTGNILQVRNKHDDTILVMSEQAFNALDRDQVRRLNHFTNLLYSPLYTIETYGGGSARCMITEIFPPVN